MLLGGIAALFSEQGQSTTPRARKSTASSAISSDSSDPHGKIISPDAIPGNLYDPFQAPQDRRNNLLMGESHLVVKDRWKRVSE